MKKFKILCFATVSILCVSQYSMASITVDQAISPQFMTSGGYSQETIRLINVAKDRRSVDKVEKESSNVYVRNLKKGYKYLKKGYNYIDPISDDGTFGRHDIRQTSGMSDL